MSFKKYRDALHSHGFRRGQANKLRSQWGLSPADYTRILEAQQGGCAICGTITPDNGEKFDVDHCHVTKKLRGLLCNQCNTGLGKFRDDPKRLLAAAEYLKWGGFKIKNLGLDHEVKGRYKKSGDNSLAESSYQGEPGLDSQARSF